MGQTYLGYFDAAGSHDDPKSKVLALAGFVSTQERWQILENSWNQALVAAGVHAFHMKDFAHSTGAFKGWRGDEPRRRALIATLTAGIRQHTAQSFSVTLGLEPYRSLDRIYRFHETAGYPYTILAMLIMSKVKQWAVRLSPPAAASFVFEKGDRHQGTLLEWIRRDRAYVGAEPTFVAKAWTEDGCSRECIPLQTSDLLAYETYKMFSDLIDKQKTRAREPLFQITPRHPSDYHQVLGGKFLEGVVRAMSIPRRTDHVR